MSLLDEHKEDFAMLNLKIALQENEIARQKQEIKVLQKKTFDIVEAACKYVEANSHKYIQTGSFSKQAFLSGGFITDMRAFLKRNFALQ